MTVQYLYSETVTVQRALTPEQTLEIVRMATRYDSEIQFRKYFFQGEAPLGGLTREANGKSVLGMLSLNLAKGDRVEIMTYGTDGDVALRTMVDFLQET
ncbi:HPr family phosphocarrier protein [Kyrpidia spormannii]|nr:HPr family phosphocarrier protein [Kyrpidia spormannii]